MNGDKFILDIWAYLLELRTIKFMRHEYDISHGFISNEDIKINNLDKILNYINDNFDVLSQTIDILKGDNDA